jgi:hypothetical protein
MSASYLEELLIVFIGYKFKPFDEKYLNIAQ